MKIYMIAGAIAFGATQSALATVVNGDFETGDFTGFTVEANEGTLAGDAIDETLFSSVGELGGSQVAQLDTLNLDFDMDGQIFDALGVLTLNQRVTVSPDAPLLTFDVGVIGNSADPTGSGTSDRDDVLILRIATLRTFDIFVGGFDVNPGGIPEFFDIDVAATNIPDAVLDTRVEIDLTRYLGGFARTFDIEFQLFNRNDGRRTRFGIDNLSFPIDAPPRDIPAPAGLMLMLLGTGLLSVLNSKRSA
ncbi:hypothetical protein KCG44_08660 [Pacificimonas sp. WHA3]|uniref:PEP-CTERM protein-sorting domain-containing protein n=1 Tax=Pacificimonas pallii TaxID=2827236 RepID=A0ABS6SG22_9SPHN|nr:hypothetical protein [Pacificimonas pallii]MBV7256856.1 hypothetical protein [Pacificimonas pallii]